MGQDSQLSLEEFRKALTPSAVRALQIIQGALGMGVIAFAGVVFFLYFNPNTGSGQSSQNPASIVQLLILVHVAMAFVMYPIAFILYRVNITRKKVLESNNPTLANLSLPDKCLGVIRIGTIMRLAMFEGVAFFGLVICLLGSTMGVLKEQPIYWLNLFSFAAMLILVVQTFPTKDKLEFIFRDRILES